MENKRSRTLVRCVLFMTVWMACHGLLMGQPDPGMNGDSTLVGGGPISGGVPLGSGLVFFLLFSIGYGIRKWFSDKRKGQ